MSPDLEREEAIFSEALGLLQEEWDGFLERACGADRQLRDRLEKLLTLHRRSGDFLEHTSGLAEALGRELLTAEVEDLCGTRVGVFTIKERLGEGGVGVVYLAEQTEPIRRMVALKVVKPGMDTQEVLLRFAAERQALAVMDHPGIARVIEAGATAQGRPYFAMELVRGRPITMFCDEHRLPVRARLQLFRLVCEAVQHAHQKGIIHRDLKPSNILVAGDPANAGPKIIDFGIAKAVGPDVVARAAVTRLAAVIGTPAYMSPEQTAGQELDTRSDIYSLGVLLHELLTGAPPFTAGPARREAADAELSRRIREEEPVRPSALVARLPAGAEVAAARGTDPHRLSAQLRGDLDNIVLQCLEKEPARRYVTANDLSADIRRHLADEPVLAGPPDRLYRLGKSIRRNRVLYAAGLVVFLALLAATTVSLFLAVRARRAERRAAAEAETSAGISDFLRQDLLAQASPDNQPDRDVKLRTVLDRASDRLKARFPDAPLLRASMRETLADTYLALGEYADARDECERAFTLRREGLGPDHLDTLRMAVKLYDSLPVADKLAQADSLGQDTLERLLRTVGKDHPLALQLRVSLHKIRYRGRYQEAEPLLRSALEDARRVLGPDNPVTVSALSDYSVVLAELDRLEEAVTLAEEALARLRRVYGPAHPQTLPTMSRLTTMYGQLERYAQARTLGEELLAVRTRLLGADHPQTLTAATVLAGVLVGSGSLAEAEPLITATTAALVQKVGPEHPATLNNQLLLATIRFAQGRLEEADAILAGTHTSLLQKLGPGYSDTINAAVLRGRIAAARGDWTAAAGFLEPAVASARTAIGPKALITLKAVYELAGVRVGLGQPAEAVTLYREVYGRRRERLGGQHPDTRAAGAALDRTLAALGRPAETGSVLPQQ